MAPRGQSKTNTSGAAASVKHSQAGWAALGAADLSGGAHNAFAASSDAANAQLAASGGSILLTGTQVGSSGSVPTAVGDDMASGVKATGTAGSCFFECGQTSDLYNIGNARVVKLVCGLCNSSRKALDSQARSSKQLKLVLDDLKKSRQGAYKAKVRAGRIAPGSAAHPGSTGERRAMLAQYTQEIEIKASVSEQSEVLWPNQTEYAAYRKLWHSMSDDEANAAFRAALLNPDIKKRGTAEDPRVPLAGIPRTQGELSRTTSRRINAYMDIGDQTELDVASSRMNIAALPSPASGQFNDVGGTHFRPGCSSGSADGAQLALPSASGPSLPSFEDMEGLALTAGGTQLDSGNVFSGAAMRRLKAQPSDIPDADPRIDIDQIYKCL